MTKRIIGLITDFGQKGFHYVASMKGVILGIHPNVYIIDIDHNINPFFVLEAAYSLKTVFPYFPEHTIFIIVIDPGVGSAREILAIKNNLNQFFIGPNNGIFPLALSLETIVECIHIKNPKYFHKPVSPTFHGRDIMAPVAAFISKGVSLKEFGPKFDLSKLVTIESYLNINEKDKIIECTIQYIDTFGNCTTNVAIEQERIQNIPLLLTQGMEIMLNLKEKHFTGKYVSHFKAVSEGELLFTKGSTNFLEISLNKGNAAKEIGIKVGDLISISL